MLEITSLYHAAPSLLQEQIAKEGLLIGQSGGFTESLWADSIYQCRPIYLSLAPSGSAFMEYASSEMDVWRVDAAGLELIADLPSLIDAGWEAEPFSGLDSSGMIRFGFHFSYRELLAPGRFASLTAIEDSESAACRQSIPATRLSLFEP